MLHLSTSVALNYPLYLHVHLYFWSRRFLPVCGAVETRDELDEGAKRKKRRNKVDISMVRIRDLMN